MAILLLLLSTSTTTTTTTTTNTTTTLLLLLLIIIIIIIISMSPFGCNYRRTGGRSLQCPVKVCFNKKVFSPYLKTGRVADQS